MPRAENHGGIFPPEGFLTNEGTAIPSSTNQGVESWPAEGSTATPEQQSQGQHGHAHTKPSLKREFEMPYVVFEARQEAASMRDPVEGEHRALGPNHVSLMCIFIYILNYILKIKSLNKLSLILCFVEVS